MHAVIGPSKWRELGRSSKFLLCMPTTLSLLSKSLIARRRDGPFGQRWYEGLMLPSDIKIVVSRYSTPKWNPLASALGLPAVVGDDPHYQRSLGWQDAKNEQTWPGSKSVLRGKNVLSSPMILNGGGVRVHGVTDDRGPWIPIRLHFA